MRIKRAWARVMATLNLWGIRVKILLDKSALDNPKGCAIPESPCISMYYFSIHTRSSLGMTNVSPSVRENTKIIKPWDSWLKEKYDKRKCD